MVYIFLADGFEEIEALSPVDFLRRSGVDVKTVSLNSDLFVKGSHGITVKADILLSDVSLDKNLEGIILPGGMPGSNNLNSCSVVEKAIRFCEKESKLICAICAAPFILGEKCVLKNKNATCYPGFEDKLTGATVKSDSVVTDGNIITAKGAGVAWEFSFAIASALKGKDTAEKVIKSIQWNR